MKTSKMYKNEHVIMIKRLIFSYILLSAVLVCITQSTNCLLVAHFSFISQKEASFFI